MASCDPEGLTFINKFHYCISIYFLADFTLAFLESLFSFLPQIFHGGPGNCLEKQIQYRFIAERIGF